jgi:hypothetical protein
VYEASVSSESDLYEDNDSFSAPDDASILARSSLETLPSIYSIGQDGSDILDHSPSRIVPPRLPALIERAIEKLQHWSYKCGVTRRLRVIGL